MVGFGCFCLGFFIGILVSIGTDILVIRFKDEDGNDS